MSLAKALQAAAGNAGGEAVYIDDAFSTYLYTGNGSTQTITNGIDLAGEGGLVWMKTRNQAFNNALYDTARGTSGGFGIGLISNSTSANVTGSGNYLTSFNSNGFTTSANGSTNNDTWASWTFRKAEKFFDVVTYTGNGVAGRTVAHSLGSVPGCIIVKATSAANDWLVYHTSLGNTQGMSISSTSAAATSTTYWNNTSPTSTEFTVGSSPRSNENGTTFVAYLFAHDAGGFGDGGSENVISCGSFTANANTTVNLGFEPQWIMIKNANAAYNWGIFDVMRGWTADGNIANLKPNLSDAETQESAVIKPTATGFQWIPSVSGNTYIYIAIRRPMKPPSAGTEVFGLQNNPTSSSAPAWVTSFPVDFSLVGRTSTWDGYASSRLAGQAYLQTNSTAAETSSSNMTFDYSNGFGTTAFSSSGFMGYMFKRAPGFFDVVCYTGTGVARTVAHNLTVAPELMIVKSRDGVRPWPVYTAPTGNNNELRLNATDALGSSAAWNSTTPTSTVFSLSNGSIVNAVAENYVAYLFATCPGVSKVGSYTGNGSSQTINCGFTGGARLVLIKRTDSTGNWTVFDSARGIVAGNDPALYLNSTAAEVTTADAVDTDSTGFVVNQESTLNLNVSSATYIYLSIA